MSRFKPVSAGIVGVWDYEQQLFEFGDGRLVLRGPNGSGKTKALELLMPFVLDGSIDARRLDPFSNKDRTMQSNLLYGGESERRAYCWMTFAHGEQRVTVGVGMRASKHKSRPDTWFFVTDRTVGNDLPLVGADRVPMTRKALKELLGTNQCFDTRDAHRAAVNRALFGFEGDRYEAMIELILTLRRPQLAKELNPESLSDVLSEGLRTVGSEQLRTSAEAFENLEQTQRDLSEIERANKAASDTLTVWRTYLRTRAHTRVQRVHAALQQQEQTIADVRTASKQSNDLSMQADQYQQTAQVHRSNAEAERQAVAALKARDAYKNQGQLDDARQLATQSEKTATLSKQQLTKAEERLTQDETREQVAAEAHERCIAKLQDTERDVLRAAELVSLTLPAPVDTTEARVDLTTHVSNVAEALQHAQVLAQATRKQEQAEEHLQQRIAEAERARINYQAAQQTAQQVLMNWQAEVVAWRSTLTAPLAEALGTETDEPPSTTAALLAHVDAQWTPLRDQWSGDQRTHQQDVAKHQASLAERALLITSIQEQKDDAPARPPGRQAVRADQHGEPLWRAVRFHDSVDDAQHAGLEGALIAAGLLDAWIHPAETQVTDDAQLVARSPVSGPSLADVLTAEEGVGVPTSTIQGMLRGIPLSNADVFISPDGTFRLGPLAGHHRPSAARYIGATARTQHRAERIALLQRDQADEQDRLDSVREKKRAVQTALQAQESLRERIPTDREVTSANTKVAKTEAVLESATRHETEATGQRDTAQRTQEGARHQFTATCSERSLPADPKALEQRKLGLAKLRTLLTSLDNQRATAHTAAHALKGANERVIESQGARDEAQARHEQDAATSQSAKSRFEALNSSLGADVRQINEQINVHEQSHSKERRAQTDAENKQQAASKDASKAAGRLETLNEQLPKIQATLDEALRELGPFQAPSIIQVLELEATDAPFTERLHRAVADASTTDDRIKTTETQLNNRLDTLDEGLGSRFHHTHHTRDGIVTVGIVDDQGSTDLGTFLQRNSERLERLKDLLASHERQIFEDHLLTALITSLRERMDESRVLCEEMNTAMRPRKLASGQSVGIEWRALPGADPARKQLLSLLVYDADFLSPGQLSQLRALLSEEVQAERRANPDRTYLKILEQALDYRAWHRFDLHLFDSKGVGTRLTQSAHGKLSGGEKAATVHLPLFAAAHTHFKAATLPCPRLIALDEAFAGIDETGTPELLRLAAEFDLDWFLTGHNLWVTESFLPDVMHYDLAHDASTRAVSAWPIRWNGTATIEGEGALA
jgi:uncharacterized protein (TIGR02680 family)